MPLPAIEGWSLSNNAEADWESMDDWVANAAKEDVDSWYLCRISTCRVRVRLREGGYVGPRMKGQVHKGRKGEGRRV